MAHKNGGSMSVEIGEVEEFLLSMGPFERELDDDPHRSRWRHLTRPWVTVSLTKDELGRVPEADFRWLIQQFLDEGGCHQE